jgi:hypothetical protein
MLVGDDADGMRWFGVAPLPAKIICNTGKLLKGAGEARQIYGGKKFILSSYLKWREKDITDSYVNLFLHKDRNVGARSFNNNHKTYHTPIHRPSIDHRPSPSTSSKIKHRPHFSFHRNHCLP